MLAAQPICPRAGSEVFCILLCPKMATAEGWLLVPRFPELFKTSKQLLDEVEVATEPTGSQIIQAKVFKGLALLKKAAEMLLELDLFRYGERVVQLRK